MRKRLLLPVGLIIALLVPTIAFAAQVGFNGTFPTDSNATIGFHVKRVSGKNKKILDFSFDSFDMDCTISDTEIHTTSPLPINATVRHRRWHFHTQSSSGSLDFQGHFLKHNRNKAKGTLEVTLNDFMGHGDCHGGPRAWVAHH